MRLIGARCKRGDAFSQRILIGRGLFLLIHVCESSLRSVTKLVQFLRVGAYCGEVTPVPIPNTAVKLTRVDDTRLATARESRSVPALKIKRKSMTSV